MNWHERMLEVGLEETLGGVEPTAGRLHALPATGRGPRGRALLVAAALLAAAVAVPVWLAAPEHRAPVPIPIDVRVGQLSCGPAPVILTAPGAATVPMVEHDTFSVPGTAPATRFSLGGSTPLLAAPGTRLEILVMKRTHSRGVVVAGALTLGVVAGSVSFKLLDGEASAGAGDRLEVTMAGVAPQVQREVAALRQENAELKRRLEDATQVAQRESVAATAPPAPGAPKPEAPAPAGPVFRDDRVDAILAKVDWAVVGGSVHTTLELFDRAMQKMLEGDEQPSELLGEVQAQNGRLLEQLKDLVAKDYGRSGSNGVFTQPAVAANALLATLRAAGHELSPDQVRGLERVVEFYKAQDRGHDRGEGSLLASMLAQADQRRAFFGEVRQLLSPEQQAAVSCRHLQGHDMDMFGGNFLLRPFSRRVDVTDAADYGRQVSFNVGSELGLQGAAATQLGAVVERWARDLPPALFAPASTVERLRQVQLLQGDRAHLAAQRQVELIQRVLREVELTPDQRKKLLDLRRLYVPLPRK